MILKEHEQRYILQKPIFLAWLPRVQSPICTICREHHLKKKIAVQTPRLRIHYKQHVCKNKAKPYHISVYQITKSSSYFLYYLFDNKELY